MSKPTGKEVDPKDRAFGRRIASLRKTRDLTQQELAALLSGRTSSWMSQVERGIQPVRRLDILQELADALGVSVQALDPGVPLQSPPPASAVQVKTNDLDAARMAISGHPALATLFGTSAGQAASVDLEALKTEVEEVWSLTHQARFAEVSEMVTGLVPALEQAVRIVQVEERPSAYRMLARAYQALAAAFARQGDSGSAWVSADRAVAAAELSGDVLLVGAGVYRMVHAFVRLGQLGEAEHAVTGAVDALVSLDDPSPEGLSVLGSLHLAKALVHARCSQRTEARNEIAAARAVAERLGEDRNDYNLEFGPTNVSIQAVSTAVDLGDAGEAIELGKTIDASSLSPERHGRVLMDLGRAHAQRRHVGDATTCLLRAEELSPETVHTHTAVRAAVKELVLISGGHASKELMGLAERTGAME